jgi:putative ABC transport system substrate-binding protein
MDRRRFLTTSLALLAAPAGARAAEPGRVMRIGRLSLTETGARPWSIAFDQRLAELGWIHGRNLVNERSNANNHPDRLPRLVAELVRRKVDLIVVGAQEVVVRAVLDGAASIPLVVVAIDHVAGLPKRGGNVTGMVANENDLTVKQLDLLKQAFPNLRRLAVLRDDTSVDHLKAAEAAAPARGLRVQAIELRNPPYDFEDAFRAAKREQAEAVLLSMSPFNWRGQGKIGTLATKYYLPTIAALPYFAMQGGLLSYGPDFSAMYRRAAEIADKILRGAKPAEIPFERASKYELVVNRRTAKTLGLTLPLALLQRADLVIG